MAWPALPGARGMALCSLLLQFGASEWWDQARLRAHQSRQLAMLLAHARATVPFYRTRLSDVPDRIEADGLTALAAVPVLTRGQVQSERSALISSAVPPSHGAVSEIFTSGSTGRPVHALRTQLSELFWSAFTLRDHIWHRRDLCGKLAAIRESKAGRAPYPDGDTAPSWGGASEALYQSGPCVGLNITTPIEHQLEWLRREDPEYLVSHPSNIERLARLSLDGGIRVPALREVMTIAEAVPSRLRELVDEAWGVPIADIYSAREVGYLALQCPEAGQMHVQAEGMVLEIVDDDGRPCAAGETGRVVVTPLHNFAMPLIRYDIGDRAVLGPPCACGRGLPVLQGVVGRTQGMVLMPDGELRWPLLSSGDIRAMSALAPIRQYQFVQIAADGIEWRLVTERPLSAEEEGALTAWLHAKFGHPFRVSFAYADAIEPNAAGKFFDFVRAIDGGA